MRADAVLSTVARDAIDLFGGPRASRLKRCQGVNCAIPFVDTSRPGTRRWCSMERCGNRAKARIHYHQHRKEAFR
jgi:predicted RNA-binding Zn ribbon-like protein